jgi:HPt (histidine-containing phosphotransfer) domain-containing protein
MIMKSAVKNLVRVDPELEHLIPAFLGARKKDLVELSRALSQEDFETKRRIGHILAGVSGGYGFDHLGDLGRELETAATIRKKDVCQNLIKQMQVYLDTLEVEFG